MYYAEYYDSNIPTEEEVMNALKENDFMFSGVVALYKYDKKMRISAKIS